MTKTFCQRFVKSREKHSDKIGVCLFLLLFTFVSCVNQNPKHLIYGIWESRSEFQNVILTVSDNDLIKAEFFTKGGTSYTWSRSFVVVDEKTIIIYDQPEYPKYKVRIKFKAESGDKILRECSSTPSPEGMIPIDLPELCKYYEFRRIKE